MHSATPIHQAKFFLKQYLDMYVPSQNLEALETKQGKLLWTIASVVT